jgi:hypothetical protein
MFFDIIHGLSLSKTSSCLFIFLDKDKTLDNVQKRNICTNVYHRHKL